MSPGRSGLFVRPNNQSALTPRTDAWIPDYMANVPGLIAKHGGNYIVRTDAYERLEGEATEPDPALIVIIEWPSKDAETAFLSDPDYAPFHEARAAGADNAWFSVPGLG